MFDISEETVIVKQPIRTWHLDVRNKKISEIVNDELAVDQLIFFRLMTPRYKHEILTWNFGETFEDLFGKPFGYVKAETERRIKECLLADNRIKTVDKFQFDEIDKNKLVCNFTVATFDGTYSKKFVMKDYRELNIERV